MKDWATMGAGDWYTDGTQLDMLAGIEGDGHGTLDLLEVAAAEPVEAERADGALFGLTLVDAPADADALFAVAVAA